MKKKLILFIISLFSLIQIASAEGTSIILDNDQTTAMSGSALVVLSLAVAIFAILIIVKILMMGKGD